MTLTLIGAILLSLNHSSQHEAVAQGEYGGSRSSPHFGSLSLCVVAQHLPSYFAALETIVPFILLYILLLRARVARDPSEGPKLVSIPVNPAISPGSVHIAQPPVEAKPCKTSLRRSRPVESFILLKK